MVDSEKVNGNYHHANPVWEFKEKAGKFASDLLELTELQRKLFQMDAKEAFHGSVVAIAATILGSISLLGCIPIVILGVSTIVSLYFNIPAWVAQLLVSGCIALSSIACIAIAIRSLAKSSSRFQRSSAEFSKNVEWTKDVLRGVSSR